VQFAALYAPTISDWPPSGNIEAEYSRILIRLEKIRKLPLARPFTKPVDLDTNPAYALRVDFPIDRSVIKRRLDNRFHRRAAAIDRDIQYNQINASIFYPDGSSIVRHAEVISTLCQKMINNRDKGTIRKWCEEAVANVITVRL
jgi:bromodomain and WD repeat domain-containing protein 1/3